MKAVILAGGLGTRLSEETGLRPKPMVEIGGRPILWHILKIYSQHGINDFVICCGYKGYLIKEYFANYYLHMSDVTFDVRENKMQVHQSVAEPWRVTLVDTGENAGTGGRLKKSRRVSGGRRRFLHDLWRWRKRHRYLWIDRFSSRARKARDGHCRAASCTFRRLGNRRNGRSFIPGKTKERGRLDQRRFFRPFTRGTQGDSRRERDV